MLHVDEGALHAYLDGALDEYPAAEAEQIRAHLDACAHCAERLEVERQLRTDAHGILALASPNVELPSLEELRAYVKRTRPKPSRFSARVYRMGWAASVVLAIGTGWMLRDGQLATSSADAFRESQGFAAGVSPAPATDAAAEPTETVDEEAPARDAAVAAPVVGAAQVERPVVETSTPPDAEEAQEARRRAAVPADDPAPTAMALEEIVVPAPAEERQESFEVAAAPPAEPTELSALATPERVADSLLRFGDAAAANTLADAGAGAASGGATLDAAASDVVAEQLAAEPDADEVREDEERERSDSRVALTSALDQTSASRSNRDEDVELEVLASGAVPDLEVVEVASFGEETAYYGSRITQRLPDGALIDVYRLEYDVEPDVLGALPEGHSQASRKIEEEWVVIRGARSTEELEELILRLLPEG